MMTTMMMIHLTLLFVLLLIICPADHAYQVPSSLLSLKTSIQLLSSYTLRPIFHSKITLHCQHKHTDDRKDNLILSLPSSSEIKKKLINSCISLLSLTFYATPFNNNFNHGMIARADEYHQQQRQQSSFTTETIAAASLPIASLPPLPSTSTTSHQINTLTDFLTALESNMISKVVFNGINPESATVYFRSGGDVEVLDRDHGFPYYDDPRSPAGPTQLIAK